MVVSCRYVSLGRASVVPAQRDNAEGVHLPKLRVRVLHHQGCTGVHEGASRSKGRHEVRQLRHQGHGLVVGRRGQALRLGGVQLRLTPRHPLAPALTLIHRGAWKGYSQKLRVLNGALVREPRKVAYPPIRLAAQRRVPLVGRDVLVEAYPRLGARNPNVHLRS